MSRSDVSSELSLLTRRQFIQRGISASTVAMVASSGLLFPQQVLAKYWPRSAFDAASVEDVLLALMGQAEATDSTKVSFHKSKPANLVTDGRSVSISIQSELDNIERIALVVDDHPQPLVMSADLTANVRLPFKTRIRVAEGETVVRAIIRADGQLHQTMKDVRIYVGGMA